MALPRPGEQAGTYLQGHLVTRPASSIEIQVDRKGLAEKELSACQWGTRRRVRADAAPAACVTELSPAETPATARLQQEHQGHCSFSS